MAVWETIIIIAGLIVLIIMFPYCYIAVFAVQILVVVHIVAQETKPDYKIPWLLLVIIVPVAGFMLYFMFAQRKIRKKFVKRIKHFLHSAYTYEDERQFKRLLEENKQAAMQAKMLCGIADTHLFADTSVKYFNLGDKMFPAMMEDLKKAKKFIFLEYFIIEEGIFWNSILEVLKQKVEEGVEVYVIYDDIGSMMKVPGNYAKLLRAQGIKATTFAMLKGNPDSEFNNRSHRKILVIDGVVGYTGGINIADEYINKRQRFGHWKDTGIRLEGSAVKELTELFLLDYGMNVKGKSISTKQYFPDIEPQSGASGYVVPFGDGPQPIYDKRIGELTIQNMLNSAADYAYITTPYLIIDNELCSTIENAAMRGVKVKIITPHIPDKKIIFAMTRTYYSRLMKAGVEIYEYEPGFIHAKSYLVDGNCGMVGTINLDYRSLVHHFENGVWMYGCDCLKDLETDIQETLEKCIKMDETMLKNNALYRLFCSVIKIFAPLL